MLGSRNFHFGSTAKSTVIPIRVAGSTPIVSKVCGKSASRHARNPASDLSVNLAATANFSTLAI